VGQWLDLERILVILGLLMNDAISFYRQFDLRPAQPPDLCVRC
jgi:hypothetical protein